MRCALCMWLLMRVEALSKSNISMLCWRFFALLLLLAREGIHAIERLALRQLMFDW